MVDPALHPSVELAEGHDTAPIVLIGSAQPPAGMADAAGLDPAMGRIDDEAQPGDAARGRSDLGAGLVDRQAQSREALHQGAFPGPQGRLVVGEEGQVVDFPALPKKSKCSAPELTHEHSALSAPAPPSLGGGVSDQCAQHAGRDRCPDHCIEGFKR
jgi:hypothetical protein